MAFSEAFAPIETLNSAIVQANTFGHLAPRLGKQYAVEILYCESEYGVIVPIRVVCDVPDSPWFFDDLNDFIGNAERTPGKVYKFTGTYTRRRDKYQFVGQTVIVC